MSYPDRSIKFRIRSNRCGLGISQFDNSVEIAELVPWEQVDRVIVFEKDCYALDQIRFEFQLCDGRTLVGSEDMPGWKELITELPNWLAGFPAEAEWFQRTTQPPFAGNLCALYERTTRP